ncbi:MAG: hypothetical protein M3Y87_09960 [Myxococcota bacterium]|nr:hypothetical protein [Myxococcota bacterium]
MKLDDRFALEFVDSLNSVERVDRSTSNAKFKEFERWFADQTGKSVAVTYLSGVSRQFRARVGAALIGCPDTIVVLSEESWAGPAGHVERIEKIVRYVGNLRAVIGCTHAGDRWRVDVVVGPEDSHLRHALASAFPRAESHSIAVHPEN